MACWIPELRNRQAFELTTDQESYICSWASMYCSRRGYNTRSIRVCSLCTANVTLGTPATSCQAYPRESLLITSHTFLISLVLFQLETGLLQGRTLLSISPQDRAAAVNQVRTVFHGQSVNKRGGKVQ